MKKKITSNLEKLVNEIKELKKLVSSYDYASGGIFTDFIMINIEKELESAMSLETLLKELKEFY